MSSLIKQRKLLNNTYNTKSKYYFASSRPCSVPNLSTFKIVSYSEEYFHKILKPEYIKEMKLKLKHSLTL